MDKKSVGKLGEKYAEKFLISRNYEIIAVNYYSKFGEIDIVAAEQNHPDKFQLVFIEVKTRTGSEFGEPEDALTFSKRQKIIKTALNFIMTRNDKLSGRFSNWRIDLIAVKLNEQYGLKEINHYKNI